MSLGTLKGQKDHFSVEKKNAFTTVGQIKNILLEVGVSVLKSTIKRRLLQ